MSAACGRRHGSSPAEAEGLPAQFPHKVVTPAYWLGDRLAGRRFSSEITPSLQTALRALSPEASSRPPHKGAEPMRSSCSTERPMASALASSRSRLVAEGVHRGAHLDGSGSRDVVLSGATKKEARKI